MKNQNKQATQATQGQNYNFTPINNFYENLDGATRIAKKSYKICQRYGRYIDLSPEEWEDAISAIYCDILENGDNSTEKNPDELNELQQAFFGIKYSATFKRAYNIFQNMINNVNKTKPQYNQDGDITAHIDGLKELELEMTLNDILSEKLKTYVEYIVNGYTEQEIADVYGVSRQAINKQVKQAKEILVKAFHLNPKDYTQRKVKVVKVGA